MCYPEGAWSESGGQFFKFWDLSLKFFTGEDRHFTFGVWLDLGKSHLIDDTIHPKGSEGPGAKLLIL